MPKQLPLSPAALDLPGEPPLLARSDAEAAPQYFGTSDRDDGGAVAGRGSIDRAAEPDIHLEAVLVIIRLPGQQQDSERGPGANDTAPPSAHEVVAVHANAVARRGASHVVGASVAGAHAIRAPSPVGCVVPRAGHQNVVAWATKQHI